MRIGFIPLTDAAPLLVAARHGLFSRRGASVELSRELGWATIRDKLAQGQLDAAHALAPLLWSMQLGLGCSACAVLTGRILSVGGSAITVAPSFLATLEESGGLKAALRRSSRREPPTFAVVARFSSHFIMLRDWLSRTGLDPDRDVRIVIIPPEQMRRNLAAGNIAGYAVGEPWNSVAVRDEVGVRVPAAPGSALPAEKVLLVREQHASSHDDEHLAVLAAVDEAAKWCDDPANHREMAALLSEREHLGAPAEVIAAGLTAVPPRFHGGVEIPTAEKGAALQRRLIQSGLIPASSSDELAAQLFRQDIYDRAMSQTCG